MVRVSIFLITLASIAGMLGCTQPPSPPATPIPVSDWYDLDAIRDNLDDSYILMNDLDSTTPGYAELAGPAANGGKGWEPIGFVTNFTPNDSIPTPGTACSPPVVADAEPPWPGLTGSFDGQGFEICDLFINRPDKSDVALFRFLEGGHIENIGMMNVTVTGESHVGGLVGTNDGTVSNSYASSSVTGEWYVGGLVGINHGTVSNSCSTGSVTGSEYGARVGGLVGENGGTVSDSYSTSDVTGSKDIGGLAGFNYYATVTKSYSSGSVTGDEDVGGLVGRNWEGAVSNSFWNIETSGQATSDGGTGKTTAEMHDISTFSGATWDIVAVANPGTRNPSYIWNIVDDETCPFLSWQP